MSFYRNLLSLLPEVRNPTRKGSLKQRLLWTFGILILFLFLASIPLFGISDAQNSYFQQIELLLGAKIGKLLTLGIGPIVTASIILQLLKGVGIIKFDTQTEEGKFYFSGTLKLLVFFFIIIESIVYVWFGAVTPENPNLFYIVALQLALGGFIVLYMDEVVKKWGFGSGVSLFIAAGIGQAMFLRIFSPFDTSGNLGWGFFGGENIAIGILWGSLYYLQSGELMNLLINVLIPLLSTVFLFFVIVFFQSINVEIPLSFGRIKGQSYRWPLNFFYAGVIPIIMIFALSANLQLWVYVWENFTNQIQGSSTFAFVISYLQLEQNLVQNFSNALTFEFISQAIIYTIFIVAGAVFFSYIWVKTAGMDAPAQAKQIINSGLQIPGFRKDERIIERVLDRYIIPLTILGGVGIGILASFADILGALTSGTGILLMIMIIYQFYQQLTRESLEDFSLLRKFMRK